MQEATSEQEDKEALAGLLVLGGAQWKEAEVHTRTPPRKVQRWQLATDTEYNPVYYDVERCDRAQHPFMTYRCEVKNKMSRGGFFPMEDERRKGLCYDSEREAKRACFLRETTGVWPDPFGTLDLF